MPGSTKNSSVLGSLLRKGTLGWRILSWFLALSLLPLFLTNAVGYAVSLRILEGQVESFLNSLTQSQAAHVAHQVRLHEFEMEGFFGGHREIPALIRAAAAEAGAGQPDGAATSVLVDRLKHELGESAVFDEFAIATADGTWLLSTADAPGQPSWFGAWAEGQEWIGTSTTEAWSRGEQVLPVLTVAHPAADDLGLAGVFIGVVYSAGQRRFLGIPEHMAGYVESYIVSADGRPLIFSHAHRPIDFSQRLDTPILDVPPGSVSEYVNYEGASVAATSADIPGMTWKYIAEASHEVMFGEMRRLRLMSTVFGTLFALLLVATVWLVARSLVSPVQKIVAAAERLRARELGVQVQVDRSDELGQLAHTFNLMSSELESSAKEIQELHEQEMTRAAQFASVGELASGIAHEIKNPVAGITSGVELLAQRAADDQSARETLGQMRTHLGQIETSVNDLLSYARPRKPDTVRIDPVQIVDESLSLLAAQAEAGGVKINRLIDSDVPPVTVDPAQMTHALLNLSLNAIQAMPEGGELTIHVGHDQDTVRIEVLDTGVGIPEDQLRQVFRPFFTTKHRGSGLGLAITRGIVERNGGRLEVESTPGIGSKFTLALPIPGQEEDE
ncbi:MAG: ATP-binding protein [Gemmatimonadota bacterium]